MRHRFFTPFLSLLVLIVGLTYSPRVLGLEEKLKCPICGMNFKAGSKTSFEATHEGKPVAACSFACARRLHKRYEKDPLFAHDFLSAKKIDSSTAYFLVKSKNVLKELDFDMPPSVVAFADQAEAKKVQQRLKDGEVIKGFNALEKAYE